MRVEPPAGQSGACRRTDLVRTLRLGVDVAPKPGGRRRALRSRLEGLRRELGKARVAYVLEYLVRVAFLDAAADRTFDAAGPRP